MNPTDVVVSGPMLFAVLLSLAAGAVSFASPCVVPLVPGYLAYLAGLVGAERPPAPADAMPASARSIADRGCRGAGVSAAPRRRARLVIATALFVAGFTTVFTLGLGAIVWFADLLLIHQTVLQVIGGGVTVAMGLIFVGLVPALQRDTRRIRSRDAGILGAPLLGATFGLGWTPCLGPTLTGVIALAAGTPSSGGASVRGLILVLAYCAGLGLPFLLLSLGTARTVRMHSWLSAHSRSLQRAGGVMLVAVGLTLASGLWSTVTAWLRGPVSGFTTIL